MIVIVTGCRDEYDRQWVKIQIIADTDAGNELVLPSAAFHTLDGKWLVNGSRRFRKQFCETFYTTVVSNDEYERFHIESEDPYTTLDVTVWVDGKLKAHERGTAILWVEFKYNNYF